MTNTSLLILAMTAHVALTILLYVGLTIARAPTVWGFGISSPRISHLEKQVSANLSNQFEWPLFFHIACILIMTGASVSPAHLSLAGVFIVGRIIHSAVQIFGTSVRLRGLVFTINFLAVIGLWASIVATHMS